MSQRETKIIIKHSVPKQSGKKFKVNLMHLSPTAFAMKGKATATVEAKTVPAISHERQALKIDFDREEYLTSWKQDLKSSNTLA